MSFVTMRFYEELNDFLTGNKKKKPFQVYFTGRQTVKDIIESEGVPHTEVDLILVNSRSVGFGHIIADKDYISVYPEFELLDISPLKRLRPAPLREPKFILDVHLGKLTGLLRILGFDTAYRNDYGDEEIAATAAKEKRIVLTRDKGILKRNSVERGYWIRSVKPAEQSREVVRKFDLRRSIRPFFRCMICNGIIESVDKAVIEAELLPRTRKYFDQFYRCRQCGKIYWEGSHHKKLLAFITEMQEGKY
jgi:uncharacterized protein with PIN domain